MKNESQPKTVIEKMNRAYEKRLAQITIAERMRDITIIVVLLIAVWLIVSDL